MAPVGSERAGVAEGTSASADRLMAASAATQQPTAARRRSRRRGWVGEAEEEEEEEEERWRGLALPRCGRSCRGDWRNGNLRILAR
jgi:hypothetical protein